MKGETMGIWNSLFGKKAASASSSSVPVPAPQRDTQGIRRRVNVGLDFGTSATKVIVRINNDPAPATYLAVGPSGHDQSVLYPSAAVIAGGRLLLGHAAESHSSGVVRSFKMSLPSEIASTDVRRHAWRGKLQMPVTGWSAEKLSTLYLAWVLGDVLNQVKRHLGGAELLVTINAAAPLDQIGHDPQMKAMFHRIVFRANFIRELAAERWDIDAAGAALQRATQAVIPSDEESPVTLLPESHAAMTSYLLMPGRRKGMFATVDIGAGTTDVAFFWFHATGGTPELHYYGSCSRFVGMDDLDKAYAGVNGSIEVGRARRLRGQDNEAVNELITAELDAVFECYRRGFGRSYDRLRGYDAWHNQHGHAKYTLCLVGGGSQDANLKRRLTMPLDQLRFKSVDVQVLRVPDDLRVLRPGGLRPISQVAPAEMPLMLLAHGLSHRAVDIPLFDEAKRDTSRKPIYVRPTHEEIYAR